MISPRILKLQTVAQYFKPTDSGTCKFFCYQLCRPATFGKEEHDNAPNLLGNINMSGNYFHILNNPIQQSK